MTADPQALFTRDGPLLVPTEASLGPWRPDALHGGAVSALLGHSLAEDGWQLARVTMDLLRRVPLQPLRLTVSATTNSRRVSRERLSSGLETNSSPELLPFSFRSPEWRYPPKPIAGSNFP